MLSIKTLKFEEITKGCYYCKIFNGFRFEIEETNGFFDVYITNRDYTHEHKTKIAHSLDSFIGAKRTCRMFLMSLFENAFEIRKEIEND